MGSSTTPAAFVSKIDAATRAIASNREAIQATALHAKVVFIGAAAASGVGRGVGRSPVSRKVSARYDLRGGEQNASALVRYTGPAHLLNNPTKPHIIRPRKFAGTRGRGARAQRGAGLLSLFGVDAQVGGGIEIPGEGVRRYAMHPGTRGLHFAERAKRECGHECPKVYRRVGIKAPLKAAFK